MSKGITGNGAAPHPVEKSMDECRDGKTITPSHHGEAAKQSLKYDKELNRSLPQETSNARDPGPNTNKGD